MTWGSMTTPPWYWKMSADLMRSGISYSRSKVLSATWNILEMYSILVRMFCRYRQAELWEEASISRSGGNPAARSALASAAPFCQCSCKKGLVTNASQLCFAHLASSKSVSSSPTYQRRSVSIGSNTRKCLRGACPRGIQIFSQAKELF